MFEFFLIPVFFAVVFAVLYLPAVYRICVAKKAKKEFLYKLNLLDGVFTSNLLISTDKLGQGESQNSDFTFAKAQKNQTLAIDSVKELIREMAGK